MPEWLFARETIIALAIAGGAMSLLASVLLAQGKATPQRAKQLNRIGYTLMLLSMGLFIVAGFRTTTP
jgi:ABC-type uncharacterized transport system YnjBCD permease subunit